jgi:uncharacterized protein YjiS (DUF1127 family)
MLALHRSRCLLHSSRLLQIRTLRTVPQRIPTHIKRWDPTVHRSTRPQKVSIEDAEAHQAGIEGIKPEVDKDLGEPPAAMAARREVRSTAQYTRKKLKHLLRLGDVEAIDDVGLRRPLWKAYTNAKYSDTHLCSSLSDHDWHILWSVQSRISADNRNRTLHLEELGRDMRLWGKSLTTAQRAAYLEAVFVNGKESEAMRGWEDDHACLKKQNEQDYEPDHLEVGVKLYALAGHADRALELMHSLFDLYPGWNPSVMMLVFRAHTDSNAKACHEAAKDIYDRYRVLMGNRMTIEDYDTCLVGFLEARHLQFAKRVFRDMIKDGHLATTGTRQDVEALLKRLHMLYRLGTDISSMTSIALDAIALLPPEYHGHLYGDWMKSAVVQKAPQAAAQILDIMIQRGYVPEVFHFNMLLKALLRTKEDPNVLKAENIGWRMIDEASKAQKRKSTSHSTAEEIHARAGSAQVMDVDAARKVPHADVTTFALIMHHHAKSLHWEHVDYLSRQLKDADVTPNATIMNVLIDNKCRKGAYTEAWAIYKQLTDPPAGVNTTGVFPDGATFRCLWKTLRLALGDYATRDDPNLPTPRDLLKEMIEWWTQCRSRYDANRFHLGLTASDRGALTALILHCFSYTQDLAGSLIALHVLRHQFNIFPTDKVVEILQRQMAWVDMHTESEHVRHQHFASRSNTRNSERVARIYDILLQRRIERMGLGPGEHEKLSDEEVGDVGLDLLSEFVRVVLKRRYPPEVVEEMIHAARCVVGLPELPTGDMDAFEVV